MKLWEFKELLKCVAGRRGPFIHWTGPNSGYVRLRLLPKSPCSFLTRSSDCPWRLCISEMINVVVRNARERSPRCCARRTMVEDRCHALYFKLGSDHAPPINGYLAPRVDFGQPSRANMISSTPCLSDPVRCWRGVDCQTAAGRPCETLSASFCGSDLYTTIARATI